MISKVQLSIFTKRYDWTRAIHSVSTDNRPTPRGVSSLYVWLAVLITYLRQASAAQAGFLETCRQPHGAAITAEVSHV